MRVRVGIIVGQIAAGRTIEEVLSDYPYLDREDVLQALRYAAWLAEDRKVSSVMPDGKLITGPTSVGAMLLIPK